ncbi:hypothetical protein [Mycetohabitans endofungorum]|nr:hypothetical protein [Mycetohabitans endofungorum]
MTSFLRWKPFSQVSTGPKIAGQVICAAGHNLRMILRKLRLFYALI